MVAPGNAGGHIADLDKAPTDAPVPLIPSTLPPQSATCNNLLGTPGDCSKLEAPGPICAEFNFTKTECANLKAGMRPREAERAVSCLLAKSKTENICFGNALSLCAMRGAAHACIDPATEKSCVAVMVECEGRRWNSLTLTTCQAALSSVTDKNRPQVLGCMKERCDADDCFYNLK